MTDDDRKPDEPFGEHPPRHVCWLREPGTEDLRDLMVGALAKAGTDATEALSVARTNGAAIAGLKDIVKMHVDSCETKDAEAAASRKRLHDKIDELRSDMVKIAERLGDRAGTLRAWIVAILLGIAGSLIFILLGLVAWLANKLWENEVEAAFVVSAWCL